MGLQRANVPREGSLFQIISTVTFHEEKGKGQKINKLIKLAAWITYWSKATEHKVKLEVRFWRVSQM